MSEGIREALVIATSRYADANLRPLRSPATDAQELVTVLRDPAIGGFQVTPLLDKTVSELRIAVADFTYGRSPLDFLLVYLSCHGLTDQRRRLFFAASDTNTSRLAATGLDSRWLLEQLEDCRARSQVLILDCCFSGAFASGMKAGPDVPVLQISSGRGRAVLTASNAHEYSFEGDFDAPAEEGRPSSGSVFTSALVEGLRTGAADLDGDGVISVREAYDYTYQAVRLRDVAQTPQHWIAGGEGQLVLARSPVGRIKQSQRDPHMDTDRAESGLVLQRPGKLGEAPHEPPEHLDQEPKPNVFRSPVGRRSGCFSRADLRLPRASAALAAVVLVMTPLMLNAIAGYEGSGWTGVPERALTVASLAVGALWLLASVVDIASMSRASRLHYADDVAAWRQSSRMRISVRVRLSLGLVAAAIVALPATKVGITVPSWMICMSCLALLVLTVVYEALGLGDALYVGGASLATGAAFVPIYSDVPGREEWGFNTALAFGFGGFLWLGIGLVMLVTWYLKFSTPVLTVWALIGMASLIVGLGVQPHWFIYLVAFMSAAASGFSGAGDLLPQHEAVDPKTQHLGA